MIDRDTRRISIYEWFIANQEGFQFTCDLSRYQKDFNLRVFNRDAKNITLFDCVAKICRAKDHTRRVRSHLTSYRIFTTAQIHHHAASVQVSVCNNFEVYILIKMKWKIFFNITEQKLEKFDEDVYRLIKYCTYRETETYLLITIIVFLMWFMWCKTIEPTTTFSETNTLVRWIGIRRVQKYCRYCETET